MAQNKQLKTMEEIQSTISHLIDKVSAASSNLCCLKRCVRDNIIDGDAIVGRLHPVTVMKIIEMANVAMDEAYHEIQNLRGQLKSLES